MIRRSPTRIDLRLEDLQEYDPIKKEHESKKESERQSVFNLPLWGGKVTQSEIQERIGYAQQSRPNL